MTALSPGLLGSQILAFCQQPAGARFQSAATAEIYKKLPLVYTFGSIALIQATTTPARQRRAVVVLSLVAVEWRIGDAVRTKRRNTWAARAIGPPS